MPKKKELNETLEDAEKEMENSKDDLQEDIVIKEPDEKFVMWKPEKKGDSICGKLMAISETKFNKVLRISTDDGVESVPISTFLEDVDFERYIGEIITLEYQGTAGKRNCKLFRVSVRQDKF